MKKLPKKPTKSAAASVQSQPLTEADYDFSRVPDNEIMACLLFELLRESATARQLEGDLIVASPKAQKRLQALGFNINHRVNVPGFIRYAIDSAWQTGVELLKAPWLELKTEAKEVLTYQCEQVEKPAYISTDVLETDVLFRQMRLDHALDLKAFESNHDAPSTTIACAPLDSLDDRIGRVIFGITTNYARYDDNAIRAELDLLREEIISRRPKGLKPQVRQESGLGRLAEWRGKLNSLGRARLYCHYAGVNALKQANPTAHQWVVASLINDKGDRAALKALSDAKARFVRAFHEILPFEKGALPLCVANSRFNR